MSLSRDLQAATEDVGMSLAQGGDSKLMMVAGSHAADDFTKGIRWSKDSVDENADKHKKQLRSMIDLDDKIMVKYRKFYGEALKKLSAGGNRTRHEDLEEGAETNPTKAGPAAEKKNVAKQAASGIDRMLAALEAVRGWIKSLDIGAHDRSGAAAAALKVARQEIAGAYLGEDFGLLDWGIAVLEATEITLDEAKKGGPGMSPTASQALEGLSRLVDGLVTLRGMVRQLKIDSVIEKLDAAISGLKLTRETLATKFAEEDGTEYGEVVQD